MRAGELNQITDVLGIPRIGSHDLRPAAVESRFDQIDLIVARWPVFTVPQHSGNWIKGQAEAITNAVGIIFRQVASLGKKWIVIRSAAIIIDAENHSRVIRRRTAGIVLQLVIVIQVAPGATGRSRIREGLTNALPFHV